MIVVPGRSAGAEHVPQVEPSEAGGDGPMVLVIDRQPLFLAALGSLLTSPPVRARLRFAPHSDVGLDIVTQGGVDLVFCEVRAEPISALDLADRLSELTPKVPVILLGDTEDEGLVAAAFPSQAAGPFR